MKNQRRYASVMSLVFGVIAAANATNTMKCVVLRTKEFGKVDGTESSWYEEHSVTFGSCVNTPIAPNVGDSITCCFEAAGNTAFYITLTCQDSYGDGFNGAYLDLEDGTTTLSVCELYGSDCVLSSSNCVMEESLYQGTPLSTPLSRGPPSTSDVGLTVGIVLGSVAFVVVLVVVYSVWQKAKNNNQGQASSFSNTGSVRQQRQSAIGMTTAPNNLPVATSVNIVNNSSSVLPTAVAIQVSTDDGGNVVFDPNAVVG